MKTLHMTREELEGMLADYAAGSVSESDASLIEREIAHYPDLQQELRDLRMVFDKVRRMDFNDVIDQRTKNLSVKVNRRLQSQKTISRASWVRRLMPALALGVVILFMMNPNWYSSTEPLTFDDELASILTKGNASELLPLQIAEESELPASFVPHEIGAAALSSNQDGDQLDGLIAESIVTASTADADSSIDEQTNEALDLINSVDIQEAERLISEVENGAG